MPLFSQLLSDLNKPGANKEDIVNNFVDAYNALSADEKADIAKQAMDAIKNSDLAANYKHPKWDATAYAFQTVVRAIELDDGKPNNTFPAFSKFHEKDDKHHPDGLFGPLTRDVYLGTNGKGKDNALIALAKQSTGKSKQYGQDVVNNDDDPSKIKASDYEETPEQKAARLKKEADDKQKEEEAKKPKPVNASAEDVAKYTFKRAQVQYYEEVIAQNDVAKGLNVKQMQAINDAVKEYCFNEDGSLKTKNDDGLKRDYKNPKVQEQIREKIREKTHELGLTDDQIGKLVFSVGDTKTRSIVGSFTAAENAMVNADKVLTKNAELIKAHFDKPENKEFLEKAGIKSENIAELADVREDKRGVYFKTNFVPPLQKLAAKEADEIRKEYAQKIADEKAKLDKYNFMDKIVEIGYPRLVEVQKVDEKGQPVFKDKVSIDYADDGREIKTTKKVPVMDEVKKPDEKSLIPITPDLNNKALKDALVATGLVNEKGGFEQLTYSVIENGQKVDKTVSADEALKDPKKYNEAIKNALATKFAFTEEEKKKNVYGGANLDKGIVNGKIKVDKDKETIEVAKEVIRLETERDVKIENSPSNIMLRDAFDVNDSKLIADGKSAKSALGKYEEAIKFYNLAAKYETDRQIDELTGSGANRHERKDLKKEGDKIEKILASRVASAKAEVKGLEEAIKAETDENKKGALNSKLEAANTNLKTLTEIPKDFDQKDKVQMINVNVVAGGTVRDLMHVDAKTDKERKQAKADLKKQQEQSEKKDEKKEEPKTTSKVTNSVTNQTVDANNGQDTKAIIADLDTKVQTLVDKISQDLATLQTSAVAVDNKFDNIKDKTANNNWNKAVKALNNDLQALKKFNEKATDSDVDDKALEDTLKKAKDLGVVVKESFEVDGAQTLTNLKDKSKNVGKQ